VTVDSVTTGFDVEVDAGCSVDSVCTVLVISVAEVETVVEMSS